MEIETEVLVDCVESYALTKHTFLGIVIVNRDPGEGTFVLVFENSRNQIQVGSYFIGVIFERLKKYNYLKDISVETYEDLS